MEKTLSFSNPSLQPRKYNLTFWVMWLGYLYVCASGWMRVLDAITDWYWLNLAGVTPGPLYLVISGAAWGLAGLAALLWLFFQWPWHRLVGLGAALFFALTYWLDRLFVAQNPQNLAFAAGFTLILLLYVFGVTRPEPELRQLIKK